MNSIKYSGVLLGQEMVKRIPRDKSPSFLNIKIIETATKKNGTVDLSKIKIMRDKNKQRKVERSRKAYQAKLLKKSVVEAFLKVYSSVFDGVYKLRKERFASYKGKNKNETIRKKIISDADRLWQLYKVINCTYGASLQEYEDYLRYAINTALNEFEIKRSTKLVGIIISENMYDRYFLDKSREKHKKKKTQTLKNRENEHARCFE